MCVSQPSSARSFLIVLADLQGKFKEIQKTLSPEPRTSYIFPTTVTVRLSHALKSTREVTPPPGHTSHRKNVGNHTRWTPPCELEPISTDMKSPSCYVLANLYLAINL